MAFHLSRCWPCLYRLSRGGFQDADLSSLVNSLLHDALVSWIWHPVLHCWDCRHRSPRPVPQPEREEQKVGDVALNMILTASFQVVHTWRLPLHVLLRPEHGDQRRHLHLAAGGQPLGHLLRAHPRLPRGLRDGLDLRGGQVLGGSAVHAWLLPLSQAFLEMVLEDFFTCHCHCKSLWFIETLKAYILQHETHEPSSQLILNFTIKDYAGNKYDTYHYPGWANTVGWCITFSSVVCIPIVGLFKIARAEGSLWARISQLTTVRCQDMIQANRTLSECWCNINCFPALTGVPRCPLPPAQKKVRDKTHFPFLYPPYVAITKGKVKLVIFDVNCRSTAGHASSGGRQRHDVDTKRLNYWCRWWT